MNRGPLLRGRGRSIHVSLCYMNIYEGWMFTKIGLWIFVTASWQLHTHKSTHTLTHARTHARAHTTRTCMCHHRKKSTDKSINKLANKTISLLFWACPSVRLSVHCRGHSNLVIFNRIFSKFHIIVNLSFNFEYNFFLSNEKQKGCKNGRHDRSL